MAIRPAFFSENGKVMHKDFQFTWFHGFSISQKRKSIVSLHEAISDSTLEISSKSTEVLGRKLSAFFLKFDGYILENVYQSSKVFENGGPYRDLLNVLPKDAKRDERLKNSGKIIAYEDLKGERWCLLPKAAYYDYIYVQAVKESIQKEEILQILNYKYFTDIEYTPGKSVNTQAKAVALLKCILREYGEIPDFSREEFLKFHEIHVC